MAHPGNSSAASGVLKPSEVLAKAADLIEPEGAWTQRSYARTLIGQHVFGEDPAAVCWCAVGAIQKFSPDSRYYEIAEMVMGGIAELQCFNDAPRRTQAEVIAALRQASELAKAEGQ